MKERIVNSIQKFVEHCDMLACRHQTSDWKIIRTPTNEWTTDYWVRRDYDDGSFNISQYTIGPIDKSIKFGPLSTKLSMLFAQGFRLEIEGWKTNLKQKLRLVRGAEQYKLVKIPTYRLEEYQDLSRWVKDGSTPHFEPYTIERKESRAIIDPFEELMRKYPVTKNTVEFIGNQTLREYVKQQLREHRKLEYDRKISSITDS